MHKPNFVDLRSQYIISMYKLLKILNICDVFRYRGIVNISCICLLINISFTQNMFMKISRSKASCYHNDEYILFFPQGKKLLISLQYAF